MKMKLVNSKSMNLKPAAKSAGGKARKPPASPTYPGDMSKGMKLQKCGRSM